MAIVIMIVTVVPPRTNQVLTNHYVEENKMLSLPTLLFPTDSVKWKKTTLYSTIFNTKMCYSFFIPCLNVIYVIWGHLLLYLLFFGGLPSILTTEACIKSLFTHCSGKFDHNGEETFHQNVEPKQRVLSKPPN